MSADHYIRNKILTQALVLERTSVYSATITVCNEFAKEPSKRLA